MTVDLLNRITVNPAQCGGALACVACASASPTFWICMRRASAPRKSLKELPDLEPEDLKACLQFAVRRLDHPLIAA